MIEVENIGKQCKLTFLIINSCYFVQLGLNEADTLKFSSILIYLISELDVHKKRMVAKPNMIKW